MTIIWNNTMYVIKRAILSIIFLLLVMKGHSTVHGPVKIDIVGYDQKLQHLYFTRTDWSECDCETDLYIYKIDIDSVEIIKDWIPRSEYRKNKDLIIKNKGFNNLSIIDTTSLPDFISLNWEPKVKYYSKVLLYETVSSPFNIQIFNEQYHFYECNETKTIQKFSNFIINEYQGFVLLTFQGECFEGNSIDTIIFYDSKNKSSRELVINYLRPLDLYMMDIN